MSIAVIRTALVHPVARRKSPIFHLPHPLAGARGMKQREHRQGYWGDEKLTSGVHGIPDLHADQDGHQKHVNS
jgi:hypothetical protein